MITQREDVLRGIDSQYVGSDWLMGSQSDKSKHIGLGIEGIPYEPLKVRPKSSV